jgi:hypothetical protein
MEQPTELSEYLHFYIGREIYVFPAETYYDGWLKASVKKIPDLKWSYTLTHENIKQTIKDGYLPILRSIVALSDYEKCALYEYGSKVMRISEKEIIKHIDRVLKIEPTDMQMNSSQFHYLVNDLGVDMFGLIAAGLAVEKAHRKNGIPSPKRKK